MKYRRHSFLIVLLIFFNSFFVYSQDYCTPKFYDSVYFIDNFSFNTLLNIHSNESSNRYVNYSDSLFTTTLSIGKTYPLTISKDIPAGGGSNFAVWIDYNNDSVFNSYELIHFDTTFNPSTYALITIPNNNSFVGKRRLRVIYSAFNNSNPLPCDNYYFGEAEDYTITIDSNDVDNSSYCMPFNPPAMNNFIINNFHLDVLKNDNSGANAISYDYYSENDFTAFLHQNKPYSVFISKGSFSGNSGGYAIWIDLNDNKDFSPDEKLFQAGPYKHSASGSITIPIDSTFIGLRRLRVRSYWGTIPEFPCGLYDSGETEDYEINIMGPLTSMSTQQNSTSELKIYPNPSNGVFKIADEKIIEEIVITDLLGRIVFSSFPNNKEILINIMDSGLYVVSIKSSGIIRQQKLIIN